MLQPVSRSSDAVAYRLIPTREGEIRRAEIAIGWILAGFAASVPFIMKLYGLDAPWLLCILIAAIIGAAMCVVQSRAVIRHRREMLLTIGPDDITVTDGGVVSRVHQDDAIVFTSPCTILDSEFGHASEISGFSCLAVSVRRYGYFILACHEDAGELDAAMKALPEFLMRLRISSGKPLRCVGVRDNLRGRLETTAVL